MAQIRQTFGAGSVQYRQQLQMIQSGQMGMTPAVVVANQAQVVPVAHQATIVPAGGYGQNPTEGARTNPIHPVRVQEV
jgi:hypothetical protein